MPADTIQKPRSLKLTSKKYGDDARAVHDRLKALDADYLVVVAYGKIIPQSLLDMPRITPINVHGSLLPAYRGASPLQSVFLDGKEHTGMTIMRMVAELDAGPIIVQKNVPL